MIAQAAQLKGTIWDEMAQLSEEPLSAPSTPTRVGAEGQDGL